MKLDVKMNILVVDDFSTMRKIVKNLLAELKFSNVDEANNGKVAWDMLQAKQYDFIISDWNMPKMSGIELLQKMTKSNKFKKIPFLLITAEGSLNHSRQEDIGIDYFCIDKPFTAVELNKKVKEVFKKFNK